MKIIQLTKGKYALVDDEDYEYLNQWKWYCQENGYAVRKPWIRGGKGKSKIILMHRIIMNTPEGMNTDHKDGNKLNNQKNNLRICTPSQNNMNRKIEPICKSGYKGVFWSKQARKWQAKIAVNKKQFHLGYHIDVEDAALAYDMGSIFYHKNYGKGNGFLC